MYPRERYLNAIKGKPVDKVPIVVPHCEFAMREDIQKHPDPYHRKIAKRVFEHTAYRINVPNYLDRYMLVIPPQRVSTDMKQLTKGIIETHGTIDTPKGELTFTYQYDPVAGTPWTAEYPIKSMQDIEWIMSIPWELPDKLTPPNVDYPPNFEQHCFVQTRISTPFVCAAGMMPFERFLELTITDPALVDEMTEMSLVRIMDVLEVLLSEPGIELVWIGGSEWLTPPMASPRAYDRWVQEQERRIIEYVHAQGDIVTQVHCHGSVRHALLRTIERGADYTEPVEPPSDGDITMAEAKAIAARRITLGGNVECRVLSNEDTATVEQAVAAAFDGGKERFILRPTEGPNPMMSEREFNNWMTMIDCWERWA